MNTSIDELLSLPWTVQLEERRDDGRYYVARVKELPGFVVTIESRDEFERVFWSAIQEHLQSYLDHGEVPPLPDLEDSSGLLTGRDATISGVTVAWERIPA